jgi:hypothetical protein
VWKAVGIAKPRTPQNQTHLPKIHSLYSGLRKGKASNDNSAEHNTKSKDQNGSSPQLSGGDESDNRTKNSKEVEIRRQTKMRLKKL